MRVVHINFSDSNGGAAKAACRFHEAMLKNGIESKMLVIQRLQNSDLIESPKNKYSILKNKIFRGLNIFTNLITKTSGIWSNNIYGLDLSSHESIKNADVIFLHWVNANTLSLKSIANILSKGKKVFIFAHDMWYLTGGCHHSMNCEKYKVECFNCPLKKRKIPFFDDAGIQFKKKLDVFDKVQNLEICVPSNWLGQCFKESRIFKNANVITARNLINPDVFRPIDKNECRRNLGLPLDKKIVTFGAESVGNIYKGWNQLIEAINNIDDPDIEFAVFGRMNASDLPKNSSKFHLLGTIADETEMVRLYNASDIMVCPSLADNFPNVIIESLACGTPVDANRVGGIPEMVVHAKTGFLTEPHDAQSLANGIVWALNNEWDRNIIRCSALNLSSEKKFKILHSYLYAR